MRNPKLLPYEMIVRATSGEPEAIDEVLRHYSKQIRLASLENGHINKDTEDSIKQRLIAALFQFRFDEQLYKKLNNCRYIERYTMTGNQKNDFLFFCAHFWHFEKSSVLCRAKGIEKIPSPVWQIRKLSVEGGKEKICHILFGSFQILVVWGMKGK